MIKTFFDVWTFTIKFRFSEKATKDEKNLPLQIWRYWVASNFNTQYMTNSTLVSPVKMEYGWNFSISGIKMMTKSGPGKIFLKFLHALTMLFLLLNFYFWSKFSNKNDMVSTWRNFKNIFPRPLFIIIFRPEMLKFHPYSILTGDTRVEFVIYHVLNQKMGFQNLA